MTVAAPHWKLSMSTAESSMPSPSSKMTKCSVTSSPGVIGAVVVSQPVEPPGTVARRPPNRAEAGGLGSRVPLLLPVAADAVQLHRLRLGRVGAHVKKPVLTVIGFFCMSNEMLVAVGNSLSTA